jgi:hypothetical protein
MAQREGEEPQNEEPRSDSGMNLNPPVPNSPALSRGAGKERARLLLILQLLPPSPSLLAMVMAREGNTAIPLIVSRDRKTAGTGKEGRPFLLLPFPLPPSLGGARIDPEPRL